MIRVSAPMPVETEEPEELDWDPLAGVGEEHIDEDIEMHLEGGAQTGDEGKDNQSNESEEEEELEEVLGNGADNSSPIGTPQETAMDEDAPPGPGQGAEAQL